MNDTNPPQERGAANPIQDRRRQLMDSLAREVPDEPNDEQPDNSGRVRLRPAELERLEDEYRRRRALRRPLLPVRPLEPVRFDEGRGGRELSR
jgi:hypothetical protein